VGILSFPDGILQMGVADIFPNLLQGLLFHAQESGVAVGMLAGGHVFIEDSAGPSEFAHAKLGRIVCAPYPRLNIFEMVAQGRVAPQARSYGRLIVVRSGRCAGAFRRSRKKCKQLVLIGLS
jgi:hypothetical protein